VFYVLLRSRRDKRLSRQHMSGEGSSGGAPPAHAPSQKIKGDGDV
jgi:hypothetical protein